MPRLLEVLRWRTRRLLSAVLLVATAASACAQGPTTNAPWAYLLVEDSSLLDDCPICDRLSIPVPLRGTFSLRLIDSTPISSRYAVENLQATAGQRHYRVTGDGTLEIRGEVALTLTVALCAQIDDGVTNQECWFTNTTSTLGRPWPMLDVTVGQTNGSDTRVYSLRLAAAPVRELWFSTATGFHATTGPPISPYVQGGDLLAHTGRVVERNADLFTAVGAFPPVPDLGLDACDVLPGGEIVFALGQDILSTTLGPLQHGDLLSTAGRIVRRNQDLLAPFVPNPATNDVGLDAVQVLDSGDILFSIQTDVFSVKLADTLHRGDLLSSAGTIVRHNADLLAAFHPPKPAYDYGLDALYVWPQGEIWFSTEEGFLDQTLGPIAPGDLLSDQGYIVFRNASLVEAFGPTNAPPDLGLDALYVVTDAVPTASSPSLTLQARPDAGQLNLTWAGPGRVFQVERADTPAGPFQPLSFLLPGLAFVDPIVMADGARSYYRVRQW